MGADPYVLEMENISKSFPGVRALDDVTIRVKRGQVHALMGANGAGKSTLMKILSGILQPDAGSGCIKLLGNRLDLKNPTNAQACGISIVFQELNVLPDLNVVENIFLNREITRLGFYDWKAMRRRTQEIIDDLGLDFKPDTLLKEMPLAQQQMVEIVKAVSVDAKIVILDEPTSSLTAKETATLFKIMKKLHASGVTLIYISHRLEEIYSECDSLTILRDGKWVMTDELSNVPRSELVSRMLGRKMSEEFPETKPHAGKEVLRVENLTGSRFKDISFTLHEGEILGLAGLVGAGRTEVAKAIFGEFPLTSGNIYLNGQKVNIRSSQDAINLGIAYATEDRKAEGLLLGRSLRENASLSSLGRFMNKLGLIDRKKEAGVVTEKSEELSIKTPGIEQLARNLSGGNQQKVCLVKWLLTNPQVIIFDEPTRGIDVGSKAEFYRIISEIAANGVSVLLISSEEAELLGMSSRIIALKEGKITGELTPYDGCVEELSHYIFGLEYNTSQTDGGARQ